MKTIDMFERKKDEQKYPFLNRILDNTVFGIFITIITVYALFGDDFRVLLFNKPADIFFDIITIIAFIAFTFEITISIFAVKGYLFSFFFFLDVISTLSLILDL